MTTGIFTRLARLPNAAFACLLSVVLAACGGGGGNATGPSVPDTPAASSPSAVAPASAASSPASSPTPTVGETAPATLQPVAAGAANAVAITVSVSGAGAPNTPFVTVTVCVPGTNACQTIGRVIVDTGSTGLRLMASALGTLASDLPAERLADGDVLGACEQFLSSYAWGVMAQADVRMGGELGAAVPLQVIADPRVPPAPASCSAVGASLDSVTQLGGNGVLGIAHAVLDCGAACASQAVDGAYYDCVASGCTASTVPLAQQAVNPVSRFAADSNGVAVELPPVPAGGATGAQGTLVFGIGTQPDNALDATAVVMPLFNPATSGADLMATINGAGAVSAFLDTGSNAFFYDDTSLPRCTAPMSGLYCPTATTARTAVLQAATGKLTGTGFSVANAAALIGSGANVSDDLAAYTSGLALFGLPFFYGRHVAVAFDGAVTSAGTGPYVAF